MLVVHRPSDQNILNGAAEWPEGKLPRILNCCVLQEQHCGESRCQLADWEIGNVKKSFFCLFSHFKEKSLVSFIQRRLKIVLKSGTNLIKLLVNV